MRVFINDHLDRIDVEASLAQLSEQRRQQALAYRREEQQRQSIAAYLLLRQALREVYGIDEQPIFRFGEHGKPSIVGHHDIHFNLSHCREAAICVVDDSPVGIDIESVNAFDEEVARYSMNDAELLQISRAPRPDIAFTRLWTQKEAILKQSGQGIVSQAELRNLLLSNSLPLFTVESLDLRYVYSICSAHFPPRFLSKG